MVAGHFSIFSPNEMLELCELELGKYSYLYDCLSSYKSLRSRFVDHQE